ncbi:MAG: hypothetical protein M1814_003161 [Vezdaea aestivalis]|nr:MAG: hypothetical protein M1814_003161 [Vezdaea aestivalis]
MAVPSSSPSYSNLIRLAPCPIEKLPRHPQIVGENDLPDLGRFVKFLFDEGEAFISDMATNQNTWKRSKDKQVKCQPSAVSLETQHSVEQYRQTICLPSGQNEYWFARRSKHTNRGSSGETTFDYLRRCLKDDHCQHEVEYTPNIKSSDRRFAYDGLADLEFDRWSDVTLEAREIEHGLPVVQNRVFAVLVATARYDASCFIVVQKPLLCSKPEANRQHLPSTVERIGSAVAASYVSVETVTLDPNTSMIDWRMATASDAKGSIPMSLQRMKVPGEISKDIGLVFSWIAKK